MSRMLMEDQPLLNLFLVHHLFELVLAPHLLLRSQKTQGPATDRPVRVSVGAADGQTHYEVGRMLVPTPMDGRTNG